MGLLRRLMLSLWLTSWHGHRRTRKEPAISDGVITMLRLVRSMLSHLCQPAVNYNFVSPGAAGLYGENNVANDPLT